MVKPAPFLWADDDPPSKREMLTKALALFVKDGVRETSIRAIADASGYTNPALYKFFESKDALALALFERCYEWLYERLTRGPSSPSTPFAARVGQLVEAWVDLTESNLDAVLYVNESLREWWPHVSKGLRRKSLLGWLEAMVTEGQREGAVPAQLPPSVAVALVVGTLGQVSRQVYFRALGPGDGARALVPWLQSMLLAALTVRPHEPCV